jgi:hypothetical protein
MKDEEALEYIYLSMPQLETSRTTIVRIYPYIYAYGQLQIKNSVENKNIKSLEEITVLIEHQKDFYKKKLSDIKKISQDRKISEDLKYLINKIAIFLENIYNILDAYIINLKKIKKEKEYSESNNNIKSLNDKYMKLSADLQEYTSTIFSKHRQAA